MNPGLQWQIERFYHEEAYLLDSRRYREWLELFTDDMKYRMYMRITVEDEDGSNIDPDMSLMEETKKTLATRVERLYTRYAWVERPAPRQRHFISNVTIEAMTGEDECRVRSYFLFKRSRGSDERTEELFGERRDVLRRVDGAWKIAERHIYPDQVVLTTMNISMFL